MKKQYSLALGGGAARGFVHIGVLKYLEENDIEIKELSGTSMGAIIAAMKACSKTTDEMIEVAKSISFIKLIDPDLSFGLLKGDKVLKKLEEIFGDKKIEDLKIPLKIMATNLETGESTAFESGSLAKAVRASLSLPGVFMPYKIGEYSYVDGGVTNNLPVSVLSGEHILGVSALKEITGPIETKTKFLGIEFNKGFFDYSYRVGHRTLLFMMKQNENRSIEKAGKNVKILTPDFGELDYYSFDKIDEFVELGYKLAKEQLD